MDGLVYRDRKRWWPCASFPSVRRGIGREEEVYEGAVRERERAQRTIFERVASSIDGYEPYREDSKLKS